jgi:hypothetical protein
MFSFLARIRFQWPVRIQRYPFIPATGSQGHIQINAEADDVLDQVGYVESQLASAWAERVDSFPWPYLEKTTADEIDALIADGFTIGYSEETTPD